MMSEHLLHFIPETLSYIPDAEQQQAAEQYLSEWMAADDIMHQADPDVMFWSGSENFRYPLCPVCRKPVSGVWWGAQMNAIFAVTGQARISAALTPRNTPAAGRRSLFRRWITMKPVVSRVTG